MVFCVRTVILYLLLIVAVRLLGKRQIAQMEPSEFVVTMLLANLAAIPIEESTIPLSAGVFPILTVLVLELALSLICLLSVRFRRLLCGKPVILIDNGHILRKNLRSTRISLDELTELLRQKDVLRIESVQYAILETNGSLSVFPYPKNQPASACDAGVKVKRQDLPYTIIADGYLYRENLLLCGLEDLWLERILREHHCRREDVFLLTVDGRGKIFFLKKADAGN